MFTVDHINELRAELAACVFTRRERVRLETELAALIAERDAAESIDFDVLAQGCPDQGVTP